MVLKPISALWLVLATAPVRGADSIPPATLGLDLGYRQMYNLQFDDAHKTFHEWNQSHPSDPLALTSDAAAFLFSEFDRLGVLQSELFVDDAAFENHGKLTPDPAAKQGFEAAVEASDRLADQVLARDPRDCNALFAKVLNQGMRADYAALVEKRNLAALSYTKRAGVLAQRLLAIDSSYYDAYLAVGIENYILSLKPAPVRWLLRVYGAETDRNEGIAKLQLTAAKGHYMVPYARLLLAVAALRDKDTAQARQLLTGLAQEFPNNRLYVRELARLDQGH